MAQPARQSPLVDSNANKDAGGDDGALQRLFAKYDQDGDGFLSEEEVVSMVGNLDKLWTSTMRKELVEFIDGDSDGLVSFDELKLAHSLIYTSEIAPLARGGLLVQEVKRAKSVHDGEKTPQESHVVMRKLLKPMHMGSDGRLDVGQLLKWLDLCSLAVSWRHAAGNSVTSRVDDIHLNDLPRVGAALRFEGTLLRVYGYKMEILVRVFEDVGKVGAGDAKKGGKTAQGPEQPILAAYSTFVALDFALPSLSDKVPSFKPKTRQIPGLRVTSESERKHVKLATQRQQQRREKFKAARAAGTLRVGSPTAGKQCSWDETSEQAKAPRRIGFFEVVLPQHANPYSTCFGGQQMAWLVDACLLCASGLQAGGVARVAVGHIEEVFFRCPVFLGQMVEVTAEPLLKRGDSVDFRVCLYSIDRWTHKKSLCTYTYVSAHSTNEDFPLEYDPATKYEKQLAKDAQGQRQLKLKQRMQTFAMGLALDESAAQS